VIKVTSSLDPSKSISQISFEEGERVSFLLMFKYASKTNAASFKPITDVKTQSSSDDGLLCPEVTCIVIKVRQPSVYKMLQDL